MFEELVPYLSVVWEIAVKQAYVYGIQGAIAGSIVLIVGIILGIIGILLYKANKFRDEGDYLIPMGIGAFCLFVGLLILMGSIDKILNPEYAAIRLFLKLP